jgi:formylglycine-generating enzyme required for sulfatase activity
MQYLTLFLSVAVLVTVALPSNASPTDFKQPNAYAVVIGISQYREEVIPKVPYAVNDAQAVASLLEIHGGIPKTHIRLLTDSKATGNDLRSVGDWLRMRVRPDSTVYVYYAGHGTPNPRTGEAYLVPWDGHPDYPSGLYPLKDLYIALNSLPVKDVFVVLDSCFSGTAGRSVLSANTRPMVITMENQLLASGQVMVFAAASGNQMSSDYSEKGHGLFTHYLLTGLSGEADANKDKLVTLRELYPYVRDHVTRIAAEELNREQTPILLPGEDILATRFSGPLAQVFEKPNLIEIAKAPVYEVPGNVHKEITSKDGASMVLVPAGEFLFGDDSKPLSLPAFYIDKYEVTTKLYASFLQATKRDLPFFWKKANLDNEGNHPVIGVDWQDGNSYCRYYGKRLPTEQEWEKAARGTDGRLYAWGDQLPDKSLANYGSAVCGALCSICGPFCNVYQEKLKSVGSYEAGKSPFGVFDMNGNVWEWTSSGERGNRIFRGGGWDSGLAVSATSRYLNVSTYRHINLGFRCVQDAGK